MKSILFVTREVVPVQVINNLLLDDNLKEFDEDSKETDGPILSRE